MPIIKIKEADPVIEKQQPQKISATLVIETSKTEIKRQVNEAIPDQPEKPSGRLGSLQKIREQVLQNKNNGNNSKPLTEESLLNAWNDFIETLAAKKNHSAVTNFKMAELHVVDENSFDIITQSNMHQKFIEAERPNLIHFMQQFFNNRLLKYQLLLHEKEIPTENSEKPLNTKQQYQLLIEEYPLIKELRERLKLDLDF